MMRANIKIPRIVYKLAGGKRKDPRDLVQLVLGTAVLAYRYILYILLLLQRGRKLVGQRTDL